LVRCKITIIKRSLNTDLAQKYCQNEVTPCPVFEEGQIFISRLEKPEEFCDWAWNDLSRYVSVLLTGRNFSEDIFQVG
jgi:uncharacterized repeat protein (TIGR04076 family)